MTIGQIIVKLRKDMGLTQGQLAEKLYVSRQAVSKWENGTALPGLDNIRALSEFFGVPTDMFLRPDEASEPREEKSPLQQTLQDVTPPPIPEPETSFPPFPTEEPKPRRRISIVWMIVAFLLTLFLLLLCLLTPTVLDHFHMFLLYGWMLPAAASVISFLAVGIMALLYHFCRRKGLSLFLLSAVIGIGVSTVMWSDYFHKESQYIQYQTFSPEDGRLILMRQNKETGDISYYHRRFPLIMKRSGELPYPVKEQPKIQWIANDICAITYISKDDDAMHQYVLTYGDRGQGSYYYVAVAMNGSWSGVEEGTQTWKIQSELGDNAGITLRLSGQPDEFFPQEDCVQFGTTALVLCRGGLPRWTITLNPDCVVESGFGFISPGGTITLTQVSMQETPSYQFHCDDDDWKLAYMKEQTILDTPQSQVEREIVSAMQRLSNQSYVDSEDVPDGAYLITDVYEDNLPWTLFLHTVGANDEAMGGNGVDSWIQWDSIQQIAGDESDGCWRITSTQTATQPGNQGSSPSFETSQGSYYVRVIKTMNGGILFTSSNNDLSFGLEPVEAEAIDLSQNSTFHRFVPADYSGENWKYLYVDRLSPAEAAEWLYANQLSAQYPQASPLTENARSGYVLDAASGIYLMYDGIWQENGQWVYRFWAFQAPSPSIADWNGQVETLGYYTVDFHAYEKP